MRHTLRRKEPFGRLWARYATYAPACTVTYEVAGQCHGPCAYLMSVRGGGFTCRAKIALAWPSEGGFICRAEKVRPASGPHGLVAVLPSRAQAHMGIPPELEMIAHGVVTCRAETAPALHPNGWLGRSCGPPPRPAYASFSGPDLTPER